MDPHDLWTFFAKKRNVVIDRIDQHQTFYKGDMRANLQCNICYLYILVLYFSISLAIEMQKCLKKTLGVTAEYPAIFLRTA